MNQRSPFYDLRRSLNASDAEVKDEGFRLDLNRRERCGVPEIVYCGGKPVDTIAAALLGLMKRDGVAIGTRLDPGMMASLRQKLTFAGVQPEIDALARTIRISRGDYSNPASQALVGMLTAGSSDWAVAAEAKLVAETAGCEVIAYRDVGVAGLHRLVQPLEALVSRNPVVIIVAAGMDGVLPSVVAGLVDIPVIGLPTSTGYGHGGDGEGALTTMLQACAPGVAVVNIDNGVGAGTMAALMAQRVMQLSGNSD